MGVPGAGAIFNVFWQPINNIKTWLGKLGEGAVVAVAHPYVHNVAGFEDVIHDFNDKLEQKDGNVLTLFEGPSPNDKKAGEDRSAVGTDRDPVRGAAARRCKQRLEGRGIRCQLCKSEQDFEGILQASQGKLDAWVEHEGDAVLPMAEVKLRFDHDMVLLRIRADDKGKRVFQALDIGGLLGSLKLVDYMAKNTDIDKTLPELQTLFCTIMRCLAPGDYGQPLPGLGYATLWELAQRAVRERGPRWLRMMKQDKGPDVLPEVLNFFKGPNPGFPKPGPPNMKALQLQAVASSGPYHDADGTARTALPMPLLAAEVVQQVAERILAPSSLAQRQVVQAEYQQDLQQRTAAYKQAVVAAVAQLLQQPEEQLAAAGITADAAERIEAATAALRVDESAVTGTLHPSTVAATVVCMAGGVGAHQAAGLFGKQSSSLLGALANRWLAEQLEAVEGAMQPEEAQRAATARRNGQLLLDAEALLLQHAPAEVAEQYSFAIEAAPEQFLALEQTRLLAANIAAVALAASLKTASNGCIRAAARCIQGSNPESIFRLARGALHWLWVAMLPGLDTSPEAEELRSGSGVSAAVAANHPEAAQLAAIAWVEQLWEAVLSKAAQLLAKGHITRQQARWAVKVAATLELPACFVAFMQRKGGQQGGGKRADPATAASVVLVSLGLVPSFLEVAPMFGRKDHSTAAKAVRTTGAPGTGGLVWLAQYLEKKGGSLELGRRGAGAGAGTGKKGKGKKNKASGSASGSGASKKQKKLLAGMGVPGAGGVINPYQRKVDVKKWLADQKAGAVVAVAHPYVHHVAGHEGIIDDFQKRLKKKDGNVLTLFEGPSPNDKKAGEDRSAVGTDRDPVRGAGARRCKQRLEDGGIRCKTCPSEQDFEGIRQARQARMGVAGRGFQGEISGWVEHDRDAVLPIVEVKLRFDCDVDLLRIRADEDGMAHCLNQVQVPSLAPDV
ncbi:hypothetical protein C2E21_9428 isoform A [Chlorella sorokiniana]|uniref:Uncharacterized protein n=1 Tax=Chlorella sorokiniana TaxID=3076 RepID=A0A2P6TBK4_CHLSO|nr:hypothetical protein C2E21_9428 isoform A [Chlorella sorokiniana]|eukprot:PRW05932.1 hypothetical protein C2E21_9428 isoform A [Chlorella sorokiniana]